MLAFHNDPELKTFVLNQLAFHREADKLIKGTYWEYGRGCAVGCTLEAVRLHNGNANKNIAHNKHALYETELGIPIILARLEDQIFEALDNGNSQTWPEQFTSAIKLGSDLALVWPRYAHWLLTKEVPQFTKRKQSLASLAEVGALYKEWMTGTKPTTERWVKARGNAASAYAASAYAAYAASAPPPPTPPPPPPPPAAAAASAASAADAASAAADAAYAYASAAAARQQCWIRQSNKLIELLEAV